MLLKQLLDLAELSQSAFARRLGVTPKAVNQWANGHQETPKWAIEYLNLFIGIKNLIDERE